MRVKKRTLKAAGIILILLIILIIYSRLGGDKDIPAQGSLTFEADTTLYMNRDLPQIQISLNHTTETFEIYNVTYASLPFAGFNTTIYALLFKPRISGNDLPGIVLLPGGGVKKEDEAHLAGLLAKEGYVVLTIDQRGIGETGGYYVNFEQDAFYYLQGQTPVQHLSVYDALLTYDVLASLDYVNENNIFMMGESMGGRYALIAAALEGSLAGVIAISSAGFHYEPQGIAADEYLMSIDPDNYMADINIPLVMIHSTNDTMVPIESAKVTFGLAKEPKTWYQVDACPHGYCDKMKKYLKEALS